MKVLCIGDVTGEIGCRFLIKKLGALKKEYGSDVTVVNGENSADGNGITPYSADLIFSAGADVITGGNHTLRRHEIFDRLETDPFLLRPENLPNNTPGKGWCIVDKGRFRIAIINLIGRVYMPEADNPFYAIDTLLESLKDQNLSHIIVDFHAEATAEKKALSFYLDGKISALFGTHTHVLTADNSVLPFGTGYITDIGFTGPTDSVLGVRKELSIARIKDNTPVKFTLAEGKCSLSGVCFDIDDKTGCCVSAKRIYLEE